ncbi:hypothetical protein L1987_69268 [Smallanthus sonchifolius]|uniref:Uncharacterized protein n=1 Tax=Smallanthus sonchifolius TaxID=185202 RepID=A0ACB9B711_9ASTR|nr:hypothetical protein L1987_69268 [Smallanthus sonchifolius]
MLPAHFLSAQDHTHAYLTSTQNILLAYLISTHDLPHAYLVGDRVLLFNSQLRLFPGKLRSRWSGPLTVIQVFPYRRIEKEGEDGAKFKWDKSSGRKFQVLIAPSVLNLHSVGVDLIMIFL